MILIAVALMLWILSIYLGLSFCRANNIKLKYVLWSAVINWVMSFVFLLFPLGGFIGFIMGIVYLNNRHQIGIVRAILIVILTLMAILGIWFIIAQIVSIPFEQFQILLVS
jgi:hypothetical protein